MVTMHFFPLFFVFCSLSFYFNLILYRVYWKIQLYQENLIENVDFFLLLLALDEYDSLLSPSLTIREEMQAEKRH